jgi:heme exporter protein B
MHDNFIIFKQVMLRDLQIYARQKGEWLSSLLFFVIVVSLFPIAFGPLPSSMLWLVPGIIWISALLATMLVQESLIRTDYQVGIMEQYTLSPYSLSFIILAKVVANWFVTGLPLVLITPILGLSFSLPAETIHVLTWSLLLGTPTLSLLGTLGAALTITLPRGGILLAIIILPLYVPVLVLGTVATNAGHLALLAALAILALLFTPLAVSTAIKVSIT